MISHVLIRIIAHDRISGKVTDQALLHMRGRPHYMADWSPTSQSGHHCQWSLSWTVHQVSHLPYCQCYDTCALCSVADEVAFSCRHPDFELQVVSRRFRFQVSRRATTRHNHGDYGLNYQVLRIFLRLYHAISCQSRFLRATF
jgi:hypothetical protein